MGTGHFGAGAITFVTAEVLKLTFVDQLFQLNRRKLLSIPAFASGYHYLRRMMDLVESMEAWKAILPFHIQAWIPKKPATKMITTTTPMM